jgi:hypothetical protein
MSDQPSSPKIEFAPGCFDDFDGTQEEMDQIIAHIAHLAETGQLAQMSQPVDIDQLIDQEPEMAVRLADIVSGRGPNRTLQ